MCIAENVVCRRRTKYILKQNISILGCGWLGLALAKVLTDKGYKVYGSSKSNVGNLRGIIPFIIDIGERGNDYSTFLSSDILIISITSKNITDFKYLINQIENSEIRKVIFISSTSVYPNTNGIVTEETDTINSPLADIEKLFRANILFESTIIRFGGLFGYDRKPGKFIKPGKKIHNPKGYINFIHRDDCIRIIEQIIMKSVWNEVLNGCSDDHPTRRDFYIKEAAKLGITDVNFDDQSENIYKIVSSKKLKKLLNYEFEYADLMNY